MNKVLVVTGMPGAGKEEFVKVAQRKGYAIIRMGDVVRQEAERQGVIMDDKGIGGFATSERQVHGPEIWARRCLDMLGPGPTVIDGSRSLREMKAFRSALGEDTALVAVHSSPAVRFERLRKRNRSDAPRSIQEFADRDERELGWGLGSLIAMADIMLVNEGTLEEFHALVDKELM
jgi:dephospho-CoA kinase